MVVIVFHCHVDLVVSHRRSPIRSSPLWDHLSNMNNTLIIEQIRKSVLTNKLQRTLVFIKYVILSLAAFSHNTQPNGNSKIKTFILLKELL